MATNYTYDAYETTVERVDKNADGSAKFWNGYSDGPVQDRFVTFFRNFNQWDPDDYTITETGAGTQTLSDEDGGAIIFANAAADNDLINVQQGKGSDGTAGEWIKVKPGKLVYGEGRFKISDATESDFLFGMAITDTSLMVSGPADGIYFRKDDGDTQIDCVCISSAGSTTSSLNIATADTNYHTYGIKVYGTTKVEFYIDDAVVATHTTNIPTTEMRPSWTIMNGEAVAKSMTMKKVRFAAEV